jgi:hypothetical protein
MPGQTGSQRRLSLQPGEIATDAPVLATGDPE